MDSDNKDELNRGVGNGDAGDSGVPSREHPKETEEPLNRNAKPRGSRWADEVEEDDQFMPMKPVFGSSRSTESKGQHRLMHDTASKGGVPAPTKLARRPTPAVISPKHSRAPIHFPDSRGAKFNRQNSIPAPTAPAISAEEMESVTHMKEIMAKKAEERKKQKEEEEAQIEAERKARCLAKLKEIEGRRKEREGPPAAEEPKPGPVCKQQSPSGSTQQKTSAPKPITRLESPKQDNGKEGKSKSSEQVASNDSWKASAPPVTARSTTSSARAKVEDDEETAANRAHYNEIRRGRGPRLEPPPLQIAKAEQHGTLSASAAEFVPGPMQMPPPPPPWMMMPPPPQMPFYQYPPQMMPPMMGHPGYGYPRPPF